MLNKPTQASRMIFTDLDGTLLEANAYLPTLERLAGARVAVARVQAAGIPIIFCSAKTTAEQAPLRRDLGIHDPYIVENGSALVFDDGSRDVLGLPADDIQRRLSAIRDQSGLDFRGFHEVSTATVAAVTGLSLDAARQAQQRDYSATVFTRFAPMELARFQALCHQHGLHAPSGGHFFTVTSHTADKGAAVRRMIDHYTAHDPSARPAVTTIGIGDSPNDTPLLQAVDRAYIVQRPDGSWYDLDTASGLRGPAIRVPAIGPAGWSWVVDYELLR